MYAYVCSHHSPPEPCPFASPFRSFQETDETVDDIGYYYQLGDDFLMADDDSDGIRAALMFAHAAPVAQLTLGLPSPERRQLGNPSDVISLKVRTSHSLEAIRSNVCEGLGDAVGVSEHRRDRGRCAQGPAGLAPGFVWLP